MRWRMTFSFYHEGEAAAPGVRLERLTLRGVLRSNRGTRKLRRATCTSSSLHSHQRHYS